MVPDPAVLLTREVLTIVDFLTDPTTPPGHRDAMRAFLWFIAAGSDPDLPPLSFGMPPIEEQPTVGRLDYLVDFITERWPEGGPRALVEPEES